MPLVGFVVSVLVFIVSVYWAGGVVIWFIDAPAFLLVFGIAFATLVAGGRQGDFIAGARIWITRAADASISDVTRGRAAFDLAFRATNAAAVIGFCLGAVIAFVNLQELPKVGPPLATACNAAMVGLGLSYLVLLPARSYFEKLISRKKGV